MQRRHLYAAISLSLSLAAIATWAGGPPSFTIPFSFTAHTPAKASEVNANFTALEAQIQYLNQQSLAQQTTINSLQSQLTAVQGSSVMALSPFLNLVDVPDTVTPSITYPTIQFVGANVQIVNGTGSTDGTPNGLGNLIVGYNEPLDNANTLTFCSNGNYDNPTDCQNNNGTWDKNQRTGSHNLVLGISNSYTRFGGFVAGQYNVVNGAAGSVSAGLSNMASGRFASVSGGESNIASNEGASVSGGRFNVASGSYASVSGGGGTASQGGTASGDYSSVSGGKHNMASADNASVVGGVNNAATGAWSSVSGGTANVATEPGSSVSGGQNNTASGYNSSVIGGRFNVASGMYASVSGGGGEKIDFGNTASGDYSSVSGGGGSEANPITLGNVAYGVKSSVSGGTFNEAQGNYSSVSGGWGVSSTDFQWCGGYSNGGFNCH